MTTYIAKNIDTGEVIEGGAREIAKQLGIAINSVYTAVFKNVKVKSAWLVTKESTLSSDPYRFPQELLEEWDTVTEPYKQLSRRKMLCRLH